jgi:hypothetical protein
VAAAQLRRGEVDGCVARLQARGGRAAEQEVAGEHQGRRALDGGGDDEDRAKGRDEICG